MNDEPKELFPDGFDPEGTPLQRKTHEVVARHSTKFTNRRTGEVTDVAERLGNTSQLDLFVAHLLDANLKDDTASMGAPFYALSTKPDNLPWRWTSKDGKRWLEITPSAKGRATMHDKDVLIYLTSVLVQDMDAAIRNHTPMPTRRVLFNPHDYFKKTGQAPSGRSYDDLIEGTFERLAGTMVKTNISREPDVDTREFFGLLQKVTYDMVKSADGTREFRNIEVWLSDWLYYALQEREVLTLHSDYFKLRKPIEKRLYELARKHIGRDMDYWPCNEDNLHSMVGTRATLKRFHNMMVDIRRDSNLLEFVIESKKLANGDTQWQFWRKSPLRKTKLGPRKKLT